MIAAVALLALSHIPVGKATVPVEVSGKSIELYTYKPSATYTGPLIMVFHGTLRNADEYRDHSVQLAEKFRALVVAPKFDSERFPSRKYQFGGILDEERKATPREEWTYALVPQIVQKLREIEGRPHMPYYLIGHSAGGQFLVRMSAFMQEGASRIVAANPGSHLFPTTERPFGYGFGNLPSELSNEQVMRRYLAQPLTIYLGTADDHEDEYFDKSPEAMKQGAGRYQRGKAAFGFAQELAKQKGWPFKWRLVEAPGVEHDHEKMFNHPQFEVALNRR